VGDTRREQSGKRHLFGAHQRRLRPLQPVEHAVERLGQGANLPFTDVRPASRVFGVQLAGELNEILDGIGHATDDELPDEQHHDRAQRCAERDRACHRAGGRGQFRRLGDEHYR
jgi:hypothetical protein